MVEVKPVENFDAPDLAPYRTMRWQSEHREQGIFVAEGEKVVRRLLESSIEIVSLLLPEPWLREYAELLQSRPEKKITAYTADKAVLEELTGFSMYQGVLGVGRVPPPVLLEDLLSTRKTPLLIVAVEGVSAAENIGGLVRNCVAFGADAILVGETTCSPYLRRAVRSSMGTIFKLPVIQSTRLSATLAQARARSFRVIAAHPHTNEKTLMDADFSQNCIIVLGSEGAGLAAATLEGCDEAVAIPMQNGVDSLNVGTAGAVFLYEAFRQRKAKTC